MRISDWSSDVCSSDLPRETHRSEARFYEPLAPCLGRLHQDDLLFGQWLHLHSPGSHRFVQKSSRHSGANHDKTAPVLFLKLRIAALSAIPGIGTGDIRRAAHGVRSSEEHTSDLPSLMRISYAVFCL